MNIDERMQLLHLEVAAAHSRLRTALIAGASDSPSAVERVRLIHAGHGHRGRAVLVRGRVTGEGRGSGTPHPPPVARQVWV